MNNSFEKKAGMALIVFTVLLVFTMLLHPAGGSVAYLIKISGMIIITHAIAILSLPFGLVGFWGLTRKIGTEHFGAMLAFVTICLGVVAVMIAAGTNGLILPIFLHDYKDATPEAIASIKPVLRYSFAINHAFDYIYTGAFCLSILSWSIAIIITKKLHAWIGWAGIALSLVGAGIFISGAAHELEGFRLFVTSIVAWVMVVGVELWREPVASRKP